MPETVYVADTNVLLRLTKPDDRDYAVVQTATAILWKRGAEVCYTPRILPSFGRYPGIRTVHPRDVI